MSDDRRKFKRLRYGVKVEISYYKDEPKDKEILKKLSADNISAGGIKITTDDKLTAGTVASVKLTLPYSGLEISCFAQVAWVSAAKGGGYETGVTFMNLSSEEEAAIKEFVENELDKGIE